MWMDQAHVEGEEDEDEDRTSMEETCVDGEEED
jgi:hypothetical protein